MLGRLYAAADRNNPDATIALLRMMLPDYQPAGRVETPVGVAGAPYPDGL